MQSAPLDMKASRGAPAHAAQAGFSVMETIILVAILGILITLVAGMLGDKPIVIQNTKLTSDVATLNQMVEAYVSDGGNMLGITSPQAVLDRLKTTRPQSEWKQHAGHVSGRLVDLRLRARVTSAPEKTGQQRAQWDARSQRFKLITGGGSAVSEFYLDEALAAKTPATENRARQAVRYNSSAGKNQGWVWGYSQAGSPTYYNPGSNSGSGVTQPFDPGEDAPTGDGGSTGPGNGTGNPGSGTGGGGGGSQTPQTAQLPRPLLSPSGGTYAYTAFPGTVAISPNNAPASGSRLEYRINNGPWKAYDGSPVTITSADKLDARNFATNTELYRNSSQASGNYFRLTTGFSGTGTATWGNATGGANLVTSVENGTSSSTFKHGNTKQDLGNGQVVDTGVENVLTFTPAAFEKAEPEVWFELGDIDMLNGSTFYNSEATGVTLSINLALSEPSQNAVVHINLGLISTENTDDRQASADIVELRNPTTDLKVTVDGVEYRLELGWVSKDTGAGMAQGNQFYIYEGANASAVLRGRFVPNK